MKIFTEKKELKVELEAGGEEDHLADEGQVEFGREEALVDHCHLVVLEAQNAVVDVQFGEVLFVHAQVLLLLHLQQLLLHLVPCDVRQILLKCNYLLIITTR
jgi:hypothetical protein